MKLEVKTTESEKHFLYTLLCVVRVFAMIPLVVIGYAYALIMWMLGTKDVITKTVTYFNGIAFNRKD